MSARMPSAELIFDGKQPRAGGVLALRPGVLGIPEPEFVL